MRLVFDRDTYDFEQRWNSRDISAVTFAVSSMHVHSLLRTLLLTFLYLLYFISDMVEMFQGVLLLLLFYNVATESLHIQIVPSGKLQKSETEQHKILLLCSN